MFRGFSRGPSGNGKAAFGMVWHRGRRFDVTVDTRRKTIHCPLVLPMVPVRSAMYRQLPRVRESLPGPRSARPSPHRQSAKLRVACANRGGNVSLTMTLADADYEYGARKFIHLIQEVYLGFLTEHFEYQVEAFDLDPDHP